MRFWMTLILGTVVVSASLTWLYLRMEAAPRPAIQLQSESGALPRLEFPNHEVVGDPKTVALQHDKSELDKEYRMTISVANRGEGQLHLRLVRKTCGCVQQVLLDDAPMPEGFPFTLDPGSQKQLAVVWKYSRGLAEPDRDRRFAVEFVTNDPEAPVFRVEIATHVVR
jgi:hypothetical protein